MAVLQLLHRRVQKNINNSSHIQSPVLNKKHTGVTSSSIHKLQTQVLSEFWMPDCFLCPFGACKNSEDNHLYTCVLLSKTLAFFIFHANVLLQNLKRENGSYT